MEKESQLFHRKIRMGYMQLARKEPNRIKVIKADAPKELIRQKVIKELEKFLSSKKY